MTIEIKVTNPAEHQPNELRAVALFLNNLAADREAGRIKYKPAYASTGTQTLATHFVPGGVTGEIPKVVAPSASDEPPLPDADAEEEQNTSSDELDSKGIRYDARIHSATRSQNSDKTWRMKRGVDEVLVKQVLGQQLESAKKIAASVTEAATSTETSTSDSAPALTDQTPPPVVDEETPPPVVDEKKATTTNVPPADVVKFVTSNKIPADQAKAIYEQFGLANAAELFKNAELCGDILEALRTLVAD